VPHSPTPRSARVRLASLLTAALLTLGLFGAAAPVMAEPPAATPVAAGFLTYKYPTPACLGTGLNVTNAPYFGDRDCGFVVFTLDADAGTAVAVDYLGPDGGTFATGAATFDATKGTWDFDVVPTAGWPSGLITAQVRVGDVVAGSTTFGYKLLGASISPDSPGSPFAPGDDIAVTGELVELDSASDLGPTLRTGVPATFTLAVITPDGTQLTVPGGPITADDAGTFAAVVPGSVTDDLAPVGDDLELTVAIAAVDASYDDPTSGAWSAANAGRGPVTLHISPSHLDVEASFVSSVGWVKPGETYPFRIFVTNATSADATGVSVSIAAPPSASFIDATPLNGSGTASASDGTITWTIGSLPAANAAGPNVATLVVTARAASLTQDPEVVWKDLSSTATLTYDGYSGAAISSATHGPKVIPAEGGFETARYGDKPFPIVPVEYVDLERQSNAQWDNDAEKLDTVVNDPDFAGSTLNLYQEMSFGQLFPQGDVPSAGIAEATFSDYEPGFDFTTPDRTDPLNASCRGATEAELPGVIGSDAFDTRIQDGWYQLPGTTEYYGGDFPVFTSTTVAIDQACGIIGKSVYDAAQISDPEIDYNEFDSDKDGVVDFFMMVFVGCGGNGASQIPVLCEYFGNQTPWYDNIWPHSASLEGMFTDEATGLRGYISDDQLTSLTEVPQCWTSTARRQYDDCAANGGTGVDDLPVYVRVGPYNVNPETVFQSASVISHEYGHHLGLPDFYNSGEEIYGDLNLMAADYSQHMTIFSKQELGWVVPEYIQPGETRSVTDWSEIKADTGAITWQRPDGTPYVLSSANGDQNVHNGEAYGLKLGGRQLLDPSAVPSGSHAWWSGRGNDFGCSPDGGHNLDISLPELANVPAGTPVTVEFASSWDIEWDYDYGFVLTSTDGESYASQPSENGYTTSMAFNPNQSGCLSQLDNGITGTSGAWAEGTTTVTAARLPEVTDYSHGAPFLADAYDISELAGQAGARLRLSYYTDPGFDRPGWFVDDLVVKAGGVTIFSSDMEDGTDADRFAADGWSRVNAADENPADHAYYLELRDQSGFDYDGHGQSDRGDTSWSPGVFVEYTDEAHGYGNNGTPAPPAQHYLDTQPIPGSDCVSEQGGNCADASFTAAAGDNRFSDAVTAEAPGGFVNSFSDPESDYGDGFWHFDYGCLTLDVTRMDGEGIGPEAPAAGDLTADATITAGDGCAPFGYGAGANVAPTAVAQARPTEATVGEDVVFDGSGSTDDHQLADELDYAWDFGDGTTGSGQTAHHAFGEAGEYTATLTVTDADGATATDTVAITVSAAPDLRVSSITTVQATGTGGQGGTPKEGDKVTIKATVENLGAADAPASVTAFMLDDAALANGSVATPAIPAGTSAVVTLAWDTRGVKGDHVIGVTADADEAVAEADEADNAATLDVTVRGNKVQNGSFEQSNEAGTAPANWTAKDTSAGSTTYGKDGTDGSFAAGAKGNGGNATLAGSPTWTSDPVTVAPGELLTLQVSVTSLKASSAASAGLAYLSAAGDVLKTVQLISVPLTTTGTQVLTNTVTLPPGVAAVRVVLTGFAPTDLTTGGTVVFDDVGLFGE
jgi:M6 family metalloprotease-like protein